MCFSYFEFVNTSSRTKLWSTFYDLTKSYKPEQRISQGSRQACRGSEPAKRNLSERQHRFNRCSTGATSASMKPKLETQKHIFNRRTTGARTFARLCAVYPVNLSIGLPYKCLPLKVFSLKIFNRTFLLILIGTRRDPDQVSEEALQINISMII